MTHFEGIQYFKIKPILDGSPIICIHNEWISYKYTHIEGVFQIHYDIDLIYQFQNEAVNTCSNKKKLQVHTMPTLYFIMYLTLYFPLPTVFSRSRFNCGQLFTSPVTFTLCNQSYTIHKQYLRMV